MKPFPEAVQRAFPCAQDRVAGRPWWLVTFYKSVRCDGHEVAPDEIARIDAEHPLPHPGYRAGQVWASDTGASICIAECDPALIWAGRNGGYLLRETFAQVYPYLVADPCCPNLAPWSPTEEE